jgi:hypothetical protein
MPKFRDRLNRSWPIVLTPQVRNRLTHATGAELTGPIGVAELGALAFRPDAPRVALWECCYADAMDRRITREAFVQSLDAATLRAGFQALAESYAADCFGEKAGVAMGMIASVADRLRAILTRPIEQSDDELAA